MNDDDKTKKETAKEATPEAKPKAKAKVCQAPELGHRKCQCGGPDCGDNVHGRGM